MVAVHQSETKRQQKRAEKRAEKPPLHHGKEKELVFGDSYVPYFIKGG
jgi:hypothetical protein